MLVVCDSNSQHMQWGSKNTNEGGENRLEFIMERNLRICNVNKTPSFEAANTKEVLDITLVSNQLDLPVKALKKDHPSSLKSRNPNNSLTNISSFNTRTWE